MSSRNLLISVMKDFKSKGGRPTKKDLIAVARRDKEIVEMHEKGYPLDYIAAFFNISKQRVFQIYIEKAHLFSSKLKK